MKLVIAVSAVAMLAAAAPVVASPTMVGTEVARNAEDPALRANRLALLRALHRAMNRVADLARLA